MNDRTDSQLLRAYTESRSEAAFTELVGRHVDFVYSTALRLVCDPHLAEDVTQRVFVALAKSAGPLTARPVLSGWLHRTAQNIAAQTVRTIERRRVREQEAAVMNQLLSAEPDSAWEQIAPQLDEALGELSDPDRDALFLRYFERKSAREMARSLGTSEDAAQKRVNRAVDRLRELFVKRGVTVDASGMVVAISANAVQAAPAGLAATISSTAALAGSGVASTALCTVTKTIALTTLQKTFVAATIVLLAGLAIYEGLQASRSRDQVRELQQTQASITGQLRQLEQERDDATNRLAAIQPGKEQANRVTADLLRLRNQVTQLQSRSASPNPPEANGPGTVYSVYVFDAPRKAAMRAKPARMNERLGLSEDQRQAIEGILTNMFAQNPEGRINALLSPEQQAAYRELGMDEATSNVRSTMKARVDQLEQGLSLTPEQKDKVFAALFELKLNEKLARLDEPPAADHETAWTQGITREEQFYESERNALTNILSPSQLDNLRQWQADDRRLMYEQLERQKKWLPRDSSVR